MTTVLRTMRSDMDRIHEIVARARDILGEQIKPLELEMDLLAVHERTPLRLGELLRAVNSEFMHDICGIQKHLNRQTKELEGCFSPRFSA